MAAFKVVMGQGLLMVWVAAVDARRSAVSLLTISQWPGHHQKWTGRERLAIFHRSCWQANFAEGVVAEAREEEADATR